MTVFESIISGLAVALVLGALTFMGRLYGTSTEVRAILVGGDGKNGMRSKLIALDAKLDKHLTESAAEALVTVAWRTGVERDIQELRDDLPQNGRRASDRSAA